MGVVFRSRHNIMLKTTLVLVFHIHISTACLAQIFEALFNPPPSTPTPAPTTTTTFPSGTCTCGGFNRVTKIVGGQPTTENEYPWQVGLLSSASQSVPFCGGTLLSSKTVLTAAHCTEGGGANYVLIGEHNLEVNDGEQKIQVCGVTDHPNYNSNNVDNDFSILTLCQDVAFAVDVRPACLPPTNTYHADDRDAVVSGWGTLSSGGEQPTVLHEVTVRTMSNPACSGWNMAYSPAQITASMICASNPDKDSCQGDSGGPLVEEEAAGYYTLVGVVSWGYGCAQANAPGVYARVTSALQWINDNIQGSTCAIPT